MCAEPTDVTPTDPIEQRLLSVTEAAEYPRVEPAEVARAIRRGQLPATTIAGVLCVDGERLIAAMREPYCAGA